MEGGFFASTDSAKIKLHTLMLFSFEIKIVFQFCALVVAPNSSGRSVLLFDLPILLKTRSFFFHEPPVPFGVIFD